MNGAEFPQKDGWSKRRVVFVVFTAVLFFGTAFLLGRLSVGQAGNYFNKTLALVSDTLRDVLGFGNQGKLAAEIDLNAVSITPQGINNHKSDSVTSPFIEQVGARLPQNENSAQSDPRNYSKNLSTSPVVSRGQSQTSTPTTSALTKISATAPTAECNFSSGASSTPLTAGNPTHTVLLNEISWMGSPLKIGETATQASNNEWIELKNVSAQSVDFSDWQVLNQSRKFKIVFDAGEKVGAGKFISVL